jgi:hypothetical protein
VIFAAESLWRIMGALTELVQDGQAEGMVRHGDPWIMALGIISQPVHFGLMAPVFRALTGLDLHEPSTRERLVDQAVGFVLKGIACEMRTVTNSGVMIGGFPLRR